MNNILITGGAGFIGFHLAKSLSEINNNYIVIVDNFQRGRLDDDFKELLELDNVVYYNFDLTDAAVYKKLTDDFDYIYHLAAVIGVKNVIENPDKVLYVNAISTLHLFEFAKNMTSLKKIVFSSTSEIYSGTLKRYGIDIPTKEDVNLVIDDITSPRTTYALSKMYGESICYNYGSKYDIPFSIVRYHNVFGPRMGFAHVIPEMFVKIENSDLINVYSPNHSRAFCYIDDAIAMTIKICESEKTNGEIFHVGNTDQEITIVNLVKKIANVMNKSIRIVELEDTPGSPSRRCPSSEKIKKYISYEPKIDLEEGISNTYKWYKDKLGNVYE